MRLETNYPSPWESLHLRGAAKETVLSKSSKVLGGFLQKTTIRKHKRDYPAVDMADALVLNVLGKIAAAMADEAFDAIRTQLAKEVPVLTQVQSRMNRIKSELEVMQAFLGDVGAREDGNKTMESWLKIVRRVTYNCEDVIDEYIHLINKQSKSTITRFFYKTINRSEDIVTWNRIADQLEEIEVNLKHVTDMRTRYDIKTVKSQPSGGSNSNSNAHLILSKTSYLMAEDDIVGIEEEKEKLMGLLVHGEPSRSIILVSGMGGLGKTTLVRNICKRKVIKRHFNCQAWIAVSQTYRIEHLLREILGKLLDKKKAVQFDIDYMDRRALANALCDYLQLKRYLVIIDDIWSRDAWFGLDSALPKNTCGSRIVITSRDRDFASLVTGSHNIELQSLQDKEAWDLFCRRAFSKEDQSCPQVLKKWAEKIVGRCRGLPLAIVAIGSLLSFKEKEEQEFKRFYDQLDWELTNNPELNWVASILNLSFNDLPSYLRNCFLYCSIFPEDHLIKRKRLIRLWISEGFIEDTRTNMTMEEVAEGYLNELVRRNMLQIIQRNDYGRVKYCRMHDLVRELMLSTSKKESFHMTYDNQEMVKSGHEARRLVVHKSNSGLQLQAELSGFRSFIVFDTKIPYSLLSSVSSSSRYLKVLDLQGVIIQRLPDEVVNLFNLHYLGLRDTKLGKLPRDMGGLCNLQTLDLLNTNIKWLPFDITDLRKLRHLFVGKVHDPFFINIDGISGINPPKGILKLRDLQTLQSVKANDEFVKGLGHLTKLRSLRVLNVRGTHCEDLCTSMTKLQHLTYLHIVASGKEEVLQLTALNPLPHSLVKLQLTGQLEENGMSNLFHGLKNLRRLSLDQSRLLADPLPSLCHITNLAFLNLQGAYEGQQLCFRAGWFPKLKALFLRDMPRLNLVEMEEGAMASLAYLQLIGLEGLVAVPHGIEHLQSLQELFLRGLDQTIILELQGTDKRKVQHIPNISHAHEKGGKWIIESLSVNFS